MSRKCKCCNKELPEDYKGSVCKSCKDNRANKAKEVCAAVGAAVITVGSIVLKIVLKK